MKVPGSAPGQPLASWWWEDHGAGGCAELPGEAHLPWEDPARGTPGPRLPRNRPSPAFALSTTNEPSKDCTDRITSPHDPQRLHPPRLPEPVPTPAWPGEAEGVPGSSQVLVVGMKVYIIE